MQRANNSSMKLTIIFLSLVSSCFSQNSQIFENTWYLHNLIMDGISNIPPINSEIPYVATYFYSNNQFDSPLCEGNGISGEIQYTGETEFTFLNYARLAGGCWDGIPGNQEFADLFTGNYWEETVFNIYTYTIEGAVGDRTLTIENSDGNIAVYSSNILLSTSELKKNYFVISPNPVDDFLKFETNLETINSITVYSISGKREFSISLNIDRIDLSFLASGVYLLRIDSNRGTSIEPFIKN